MPKPHPSEWGKINSGQLYGILAVDLGRAIFGVAWGKYELPLIHCLIEHSWKPAKEKKSRKEWPDPVPCKVNLNAMAIEWGFPRQRLYEARDRLKAIGIVTEDEDGLWINKNAHEWIEPATGEPLLAPKMLAYASRGRNRKDQHDKQASVTPHRDNVSRPTVTSRDASAVVCHTPACHDVTPQRDTMSQSSVTSHIERAPELDFKTIRLNSQHRDEDVRDPHPEGTPTGDSSAPEAVSAQPEAAVPSAPPTAPAEAHPAGCPPYPSEDGALMIMGGGHPMADADARSIWAILWSEFGNRKVCNGFYEHQGWYPAAIWRAAIRKVVISGVKPFSVGYVEKIAGGFAANGIPVECQPPAATIPMTHGQAQPYTGYEYRPVTDEDIEHSKFVEAGMKRKAAREWAAIEAKKRAADEASAARAEAGRQARA